MCNRLFNRYGDPKLCKPAQRPFATRFKKEYAGQLLEVYLGQLAQLPAGAYLPDRVINYLLAYVTVGAPAAAARC